MKERMAARLANLQKPPSPSQAGPPPPPPEAVDPPGTPKFAPAELPEAPMTPKFAPGPGPGPPLQPLDDPPPKKTLKPPSPREDSSPPPPPPEVEEAPPAPEPAPLPPPPPRPGPPLGIDTDFEDTMRSGISSEGGERTKRSLQSLWQSQQSPMGSRDGDVPPPPPPDGADGAGPPPPPPPGFRPGPSLDGDLFEGSLHSMMSEASGSPQGGRKRITLGGLASSSQNMAGNMKGKVGSPAVNRAKPKKASVVTRQSANFERPDGVAPPPRPPPMPPASPMHHVGTPQNGQRPLF